MPTLTVPVSGVAEGEVTRLLDALEDHDDVKEVHSNAAFSGEEG